MAELVSKGVYRCKACPSSFSRDTNLKSHMASHTPEENMLYGDIFSVFQPHPKGVRQVRKPRQKKHRCPVCCKKYSHSGYYKKHIWKQHGIEAKVTPYPKHGRKKGSLVIKKDEAVNILPSISDSTSRRQDPMKCARGRRRDKQCNDRPGTEVRDRKYFECLVCKKKMMHASTLRAHERIHTGEKPYQCPSCPKKFTFYQSLWNHSWCHRTEKHFFCDKCPRKFQYYQNLWNHYKVHMDKKRFAASSQLMQHVKKHPNNLREVRSRGTRNLRSFDVNVKPFECEVCNRAFILKVSLTSHFKKRHSSGIPLKPQFSLRKKKKGRVTSATEHWREPAQKQKRGRGRSRKQAGLKVLVNSKNPKVAISKEHYTCTDCNEVSTRCGCHTASTLKKEGCNVSPCTEVNMCYLNGQRQVCHETLDALNAGMQDLPGSSSGTSVFPESSLRRSRRLRKQRREVPGYETCWQWLSIASEQREKLKHYAAAGHHQCQHSEQSCRCAVQLAVQQQVAHRGEQIFCEDKRYEGGLKMEPEGKGKHKCLCCGTAFVMQGDYKNHTAYMTCTCGQQYQCAYLFCFHISTCGEYSVPQMEEEAGHKSEESFLNLVTKEIIEEDFEHMCDNAVLVQEVPASCQVLTDNSSLFDETKDSLPSTTSELHQSEGCGIQLISEPLSSKDSAVTINIDQAKQNSCVEASGGQFLVAEASERPKCAVKVEPCRQADEHVVIGEKSAIEQFYVCIVCSEVFLSLPDLSTHSMSHMTHV